MNSPHAPTSVAAQLAEAAEDARAGLVALDSLILSITRADLLKPAEELARLKREAAAYAAAGLQAART